MALSDKATELRDKWIKNFCSKWDQSMVKLEEEKAKQLAALKAQRDQRKRAFDRKLKADIAQLQREYEAKLTSEDAIYNSQTAQLNQKFDDAVRQFVASNIQPETLVEKVCKYIWGYADDGFSVQPLTCDPTYYLVSKEEKYPVVPYSHHG